MTKTHVKLHLLALGILLVSFGIVCWVLRDAGGYLRLGKFLALFALIILACSFLMNGKMVPLITSSGYLVSFLAALIFQRDRGYINTFGAIFVVVFLVIFVLSFYFESVYANKKLHS